MNINNDRKRPFLEEPVYHGCPISWAERFFQGKVSEFRKANKEFDSFLIGIEQEIRERKITYWENILLFISVSKYSKIHLFTYSVNVKRYLKLKEDKGW